MASAVGPQRAGCRALHWCLAPGENPIVGEAHKHIVCPNLEHAGVALSEYQNRRERRTHRSSAEISVSVATPAGDVIAHADRVHVLSWLAAIDRIGAGKAASVGTAEVTTPPSPSCSLVPSPKQLAAPSLWTTHVCCAPALKSVTPANPMT